MKKLFYLLVVLLCVSCNSQNNLVQRIAVVDFNAGVGISQQDVDGIAAIFNTYFSPEGYTFVERTTVKSILREQNFQKGKLTEREMVKLGELLNVQKLVIGDVNIVDYEYNLDVRVVDVESGEIAAKEGATWRQDASYRGLMQGLASRLAKQIEPKQAPKEPHQPMVRDSVAVVLGYLKVFPNELGEFTGNPTTVIAQVNKQAMHDYDTWRLPYDEELVLLRANGMIDDSAYMTTSNSSGSGIVLLVTDATETYSAKQDRLNQERIQAEKQAQALAQAQRDAEARRLRDIQEGRGNNGVYEVGYYYNRNGKQGVVFEVSDGGRHGKIVSLKETKLNWEKARPWCKVLGSGWIFPTRSELKSIYGNRSTINDMMSQKGAEDIKEYDYWSREEYSGNDAWYVNMRNGYAYNDSKGYNYYVRAVSTF